MILELLGECASLSDEKNDLEKTLKAEKTSTEKAKKIQEALKAHNDLIKTKLQQLENFVKKVSFQELEKKYINEDKEDNDETNKKEEDESDSKEHTAKTHTIKTWGEKIYTVLEADALFMKVSNTLKERVNKLPKKPDWYVSMKKEIAIREAEANINDNDGNIEDEDQEEGEETQSKRKK